jgi:Rrf2 family protein
MDMRTSCRFAMAVHVLAVLAYKQGQSVTSGFLADSVNTNPVVIRRLLLALQGAKLVETRKGAGLGSRLARPPGKISLAEVYSAVEEDEPFALPPREPNRKCPVGTCVQEALEEVFIAAEKAMQREFANTTLGDVMHTISTHCAETNQKTRSPRAQS